MTVSICIIATNRYVEYVAALIESIGKYFLPGVEKRIHLFSDKAIRFHPSVHTIEYPIPPYTFPDATLKRYEIITSLHKYFYGDYIYYIDVDMLLVGDVGVEVLNDIVAVRHPGYHRGGGTWENNPKSKAFVPEFARRVYYAGGFQGGRKDSYYAAMETMRDWIKEDEVNGIIPIWHDESIWQAFLTSDKNGVGSFTELSPSYCMPEPMVKRTAWRIDEYEPKILALEKPKGFQEGL